MTGQHFIDRKPAARLCARCNRLELFGLDEGVPYRCSPMPLAVPAEIDALRAGLRTYAISGDYVTHRDAFRMRGDVRGRPAVLAQHRCQALPLEPDRSDFAAAEVARILRLSSQVENAGSTMSDAEVDSLFAISEGLNGLIVESAPF